MKIERFEDIESWKKGRELTRQIYACTKNSKFASDFGLKDQITRAAVSVMNNIAEGFDGGSPAEFARFLGYAQRSTTEVMSCLYVALDNAYICRTDFDHIYKNAEEIKRLIGGFIKYLKSKQTKH